MSTAATTPQPTTAPTPRRKEAAADILNRVFGEEVLASLRDGFLKGDLTGVVPLLAAASTKPYLRQAAQLAFAAVCGTGDADAVALLLEFDGVAGGAVVDPEYVRPTDDDAEEYGYELNDEGNEQGDTVLTRAARRGRSDLVRVLVASGKADPNRPGPNGGLPLVLAIRSKDTACVEALLSSDGIDANAPVNPSYSGDDLEDLDGDTILVRAARVGNVGAVRALVESGKADVNRAAPNGERPLVQAVRSNHAACMEVLLAADGIDANQQSGYGRTAFVIAACAGNTAFVQRLLDIAGVAVNHADEGGSTALALAACSGNAECVRALIRANGIDVTTGPEHTGSPLLCTIRYRRGGWEACARALASAKGIDLSYRHQRSGRTALHEVCALKHAALVDHLLIAGGCRFALTAAGRDHQYNVTKAGDAALALAAGDKAVAKVFASGVDYWRRRLHVWHGWAMKEAVRTLLLVRQRLDTHALAAPAPAAAAIALPHLPEEIWLSALGFLRSADFMPPSL